VRNHVQLGGKGWNDVPPGELCTSDRERLARRWGKLRGREAQHNIGPSLENAVGDVKLPVDTLEEGALVHVDLGRLQA